MKRLSIGQVAKHGNVTVETVRFYEKQGLVKPVGRTEAGYRLFAEDTVRRIRFIQSAKEVGFTLNDIRDLLALRTAPGIGCGEIKAKAMVKIGDIERKLDELVRMRSALSALAVQCDGRSPISECPILDAFERGDHEAVSTD